MQNNHSASEFLREKYLERASRNPAYSLRALARDLGVSAAFISQVFSGKKKISAERALHFSRALKLTDDEASALVQLVAASGGRMAAARAVARPEIYSVDVECYKLLSRWYHLAILDLTTTKGFKPNVRWVADRLKITTQEVRDAIARLERLGLLEVSAKAWIKSQTRIQFPTDRSQKAVREFHAQMITKALAELEDGSAAAFAARDITGTTMAIDAAKIPEAKKLIAAFRRKLSSFLSDSESPNEVYQLNVQLFSLTKGARK